MPLFTRENAREYAAKGNAVRWSPEHRNPKPPPEPANAPRVAAIDPFVNERLYRVRAQLDLIDKRIKEQCEKATPDGQTLNWLCSAQARLSEQERMLAGRPVPGSLKPRQDRPTRTSYVDAAPLDDEPDQVQPSTSTQDGDDCPAI